MVNNPGGYQLIDCSGVTLTVGDKEVVITNKIMADAFRSNKVKIINNLTLSKTSGANGIITTFAVSSAHTGSFDGQFDMFLTPEGSFIVTTNDDSVHFQFV